MIAIIERYFLAHPRTVDETYGAHLRFAARFSGLLLAAGLAAAVHALLPFLFESTAGDIVRKLAAGIESRRASGH